MDISEYYSHVRESKLTIHRQLTCLVGEIPKSNCTATDLPCICANQQLNEMIELCVSQSCTIRESLSMKFAALIIQILLGFQHLIVLATKNVTSTLCGATVRDSTALVSLAGLVGGALAVFFYLLRMITRLPRFGVNFGLDDVILTIVIVRLTAKVCISSWDKEINSFYRGLRLL